MFALGTGMRIGEIQAAKWSNLNGAVYHVRESLSQTGKFGTPKTMASYATVNLPSPIVEALKAHRDNIGNTRPQGTDVDLMFSTSKGTPFSYSQLTRWGLRRALREAGLRKIRFHDLRHTCASTMIANGETQLAIMKQMRHASIQQTLDVYGHLFPDKAKEAMDRLGDALFDGIEL